MDWHLNQTAVHLHPLFLFYPFFIAGSIYTLITKVFDGAAVPFQDVFFTSFALIFIHNYFDLRISKWVNPKCSFVSRYTWYKVDVISPDRVSITRLVLTKLLVLVCLIGFISAIYFLLSTTEILYVSFYTVFLISIFYFFMNLCPLFPFHLGRVLMLLAGKSFKVRIWGYSCNFAIIAYLTLVNQEALFYPSLAYIGLVNFWCIIRLWKNQQKTNTRIGIDMYIDIYDQIKLGSPTIVETLSQSIKRVTNPKDIRTLKVWLASFLFRGQKYSQVISLLKPYTKDLDEEGSVIYLRSLKKTNQWQELFAYAARLFSHDPHIIYAQLSLQAAIELKKYRQAMGWLNYLYTNGWISIEDVYHASFLSPLRTTKEWDKWIQNTLVQEAS